MDAYMRIQKTFQEDDDISNPLNWINDVIWAHTNTIPNRDPAEVKYELATKIKIIVEVHRDLSPADFDMSTSRD